MLNPADGTFLPVYNAVTYPFHCQSRPRPPPKIHRGGWRAQVWKENEDARLASLVESWGKKQWTRISEVINAEFECSKKPKHCRERWYNYLDPELNSKV